MAREARIPRPLKYHDVSLQNYATMDEGIGWSSAAIPQPNTQRNLLYIMSARGIRDCSMDGPTYSAERGSF